MEFDREYYEGLNLAERKRRCREDLIQSMRAHLPTPLPLRDLLDIYNRYFREKKYHRLVESFLSFVNAMDERDRIVRVEYDDAIGHTVHLRLTKETREMLNLPPCLLPLRKCHERGCAHKFSCEVYTDPHLDLPNESEQLAG